MLKKILSLTLLLATALLLFTACKRENVAESGTATIVIENGDKQYSVYTVDLSTVKDRKGGAVALLELLELGKIDSSGGYGAYITEIGKLKPDPASEYIGIYTNEEEDFAVPTEYMPTVWTVSYLGTELTYTGVGLSSMHIKDGTVILFRMEKF